MKKLKKIIASMLATAVMTTMVNVSTLADDNISVIANNQTINFDVAPQIINNYTMVPMRAIFETLGATVEWVDSTRTIISERSNIYIRLQIDNNYMYVNEYPIQLEIPPCIVNGSTLVPVRAIAEAFGAEVTWDGNTKTVYINETNKLRLPDYGEETLAPIISTTYVIQNSIVTEWRHFDYNANNYKKFVEVLNAEGWSIAKYDEDSEGVYITWQKGIHTIFEMDAYSLHTTSFGYIVDSFSPTIQQAILTHSYINYDTGTQQTINTMQTAPQNSNTQIQSSAAIQFPLYLYSAENTPVFLGRLNTNIYDSESIANKYGEYGNTYSQTSIFNSYSKYGNPYNQYSAFNQYATDPPYIVDSNNNIVGRLTTNPTIYGGITYEELMIILTNNNQ